MMTTQPEALRLAEYLEANHSNAEEAPEFLAAAELRRLHHNNFVLTQALWKACGDDEDVVDATIESQGGLK